MKKNRVYTVNSLLARIGGNYKFWLIALPAVTMLAHIPYRLRYGSCKQRP